MQPVVSFANRSDMTPHLLPRLGAILSLLVASPLAGQGLGAPIARWDRDFSRVAGVSELPDGRVVVVDSRDAVVYLAAADGGPSTALGQTGDGPNEYRRPFGVVRVRADTVLLYAQNRLLRITPAGAIAGSHPFVPSALGGSVGPPRGADREGRIYWERVVIRNPQTGEIKRQPQYEIVRHLPGSSGAEVVARVQDHAPARHAQRFHPFAERDGWAVDPDGSIRIVRARDYRVVRVGDSGEVEAAVIPFTPVPVTAADREALRREKAMNPAGMSFGGRSTTADGGVTPERMAFMRREFPDDIFPTHKPPFVDGGVFRSPAGQLWVVRSPQGPALHGDRVDVLDVAGRRIREIALPAGRRLVALDRGGVYLVREDDDGLQYLERYGWPTGLR